MATAKSIIDQKFWIIEDQVGERIGTISFRDSVYNVIHLDANPVQLPTRESVEERYGLTFSNAELGNIKNMNWEIYGFPTASHPYNASWDVERKIPIYSKKQASACYYGAGYYIVRFNNAWTRAFCPKLITLTKNQFVGPFASKVEMNARLRNLK